MKVTFRLLVTDKSARAIDANDDQEAIAAIVHDEFVFSGAACAELRTFEIETPPLATPKPQEADASNITLDTDQSFDAVIAEIRTRHGEEEAERLRNRLLELLPPGIWEVTQGQNARGIKKIS